MHGVPSLNTFVYFAVILCARTACALGVLGVNASGYYGMSGCPGITVVTCLQRGKIIKIKLSIVPNKHLLCILRSHNVEPLHLQIGLCFVMSMLKN